MQIVVVKSIKRSVFSAGYSHCCNFIDSASNLALGRAWNRLCRLAHFGNYSKVSKPGSATLFLYRCVCIVSRIAMALASGAYASKRTNFSCGWRFGDRWNGCQRQVKQMAKFDRTRLWRSNRQSVSPWSKMLDCAEATSS